MSTCWRSLFCAPQSPGKEALTFSPASRWSNCRSRRGADIALGCQERSRDVGRFLCMIETPHDILEGSFRIAWDYLEATGELGERATAVKFLLDNIGAAMNRGEFR